MKLEFAKLELLVKMFPNDDGTVDERWVKNVTNSTGVGGLGLADDPETGEFIVKEFSCDELEFTDEVYYNFMGSADEEERFYESDALVFKCKADGSLWTLYSDELGEF